MKTEGLHVVRPRTAGLDVHKMETAATVRLCEGEGEPVVETRCFGTLPSGLDEMVAWLSGHGVEAAVMEGTGVYWQAPFAALEAAGIEAILVHARQVKQSKGRKTDVADSVWLACVCRFGLCTPSHVPPEPFRELRSLSRRRRIPVRQRSAVRNRVQKIVDRAGVRIGGILSDVFGVNGRKTLDGLAQGTAREAILASLTGHVASELEGLGSAAARSPAWAPRPCAPPSSSAHTARPEPRAASSRHTTAPLPPGAATSAPSSPAHTRCSASSMRCRRTPGPATTAPPTTTLRRSSATPRAGSACSAATAISSPWMPNSRPPERPA